MFSLTGELAVCNFPPIRTYYTYFTGYRDEWNDGNRTSEYHSLCLLSPILIDRLPRKHATRNVESGKIVREGVTSRKLGQLPGKERAHMRGRSVREFPWIILNDATQHTSTSTVSADSSTFLFCFVRY